MTDIAPAVLIGPALFQRVYSVSVQQASGPGVVWGNEKSGQSGLRVTFEIERGAANTKNKAKIVIYNLSQASRNSLVVGTPLKLRAGYLSLVDTVFLGVVIKVMSERSGADIATTLELKDGAQFSHMSVFNKPYGPGTHLYQILQDVAAAMFVDYFNAPVAVKNGIVVGIPDKVYSNGFVAHGSCKATLDKLCKPAGLEWSIQNGALNIIPKTGYDGRMAEVISSATGMVGIPSTNGTLTTFKALINPRLTPGGLVEIVTKNTKLAGYCKIRKCKYVGDTHGQEWTVEVEAAPIDSKVSKLPVAQGQTYLSGVVK